MSQFRPYGGSPSQGPSKDVESTIRELAQDFCTSFNTGNFDQCASLFSPDGFLFPQYRQAVQGHKAVERTLQQMADDGYEDWRWETISVDATADLAVELGRYTASVRAGGSRALPERGKYLASWRRVGAWRITAVCWSSDAPPVVASQDQVPRTA
ncbi:MAG TPA: nuclear transport factor 2 family protein [Terriglobales bacterium]|nr:nuclear transport factor 2 family protein [Terriglobales bacterium]